MNTNYIIIATEFSTEERSLDSYLYPLKKIMFLPS